MFPRVREITDALGGRLRLSVEAHPAGAVVLLERPDQRDCPRVALDGYGAELLWGYIMAARLAMPHGLPDEPIDGRFPATLRVVVKPRVTMLIDQDALERPFELPATFWDRLYAELCLVTAHTRELGRRRAGGVQ
jgi:hypothetical protein